MAKSKRQRRARPQHSRPGSAASRTDSAAGEGRQETLARLRQASGLTQVALAERMAASQRAISHVEHEPNPRLATLGGYIGALGGRLEVRAVFDDRAVELQLPATSRAATRRNEPQRATAAIPATGSPSTA